MLTTLVLKTAISVTIATPAQPSMLTQRGHTNTSREQTIRPGREMHMLGRNASSYVNRIAGEYKSTWRLSVEQKGLHHGQMAEAFGISMR